MALVGHDPQAPQGGQTTSPTPTPPQTSPTAPAGTTGSGTAPTIPGQTEEEGRQSDVQTQFEKQQAGDFGAELTWQELLFDSLRALLKTSSKEAGMDPFAMDAWFFSAYPTLLQWLDSNILQPSVRTTLGGREAGQGVRPGAELTRTPEGLLTVRNAAIAWMGQFLPFDMTAKAGTGTGRRGSGGRVGPTLADFDLEQMAEGVTSLWRSLLLDEPGDPRGIARSYADAIIANPEQKLDFETFVRGQIKQDPRWSLLYGNKPEGITEEMYLAPYLQQAFQALGGTAGETGRLRDTVTPALTLGASPEQFQQRLRRTREVSGSSGFISNFQNVVEGAAGVLRG